MLGHEITHYTNDHVLRALRDENRKTGIAHAAGIVLTAMLGVAEERAGLEPNKAALIPQDALSIWVRASISGYSRGLEREADDGGIRRMIASGYDASGALAALQRLAEQPPSELSVQLPMYASHPRLAERIASCRRLLRLRTRAGAVGSGQEIRRAEYQAQLADLALDQVAILLEAGALDRAEATLEAVIAKRDSGRAEFLKGEIAHNRSPHSDVNEARALAAYDRAVALADSPPMAFRQQAPPLLAARQSGSGPRCLPALPRACALAPDAPLAVAATRGERGASRGAIRERCSQMILMDRARLTHVLLALVGCGASVAFADHGQDPDSNFMIPRAELISTVKTIGVMPLSVADEVPDADAVSARYEGEIVARLTSAGFVVVLPSAMREIRERVRATLGGLYDPMTGRPINEKVVAYDEFSDSEYRTAHKVDAVLQGAIIMQSVMFSSDKASWDGVVDSSSGRSGVGDFMMSMSGAGVHLHIPDLSMSVSLADTRGKLLYTGAGGLQVLAYERAVVENMLATTQQRYIDAKFILTDPARDARALSLALDPLLRGSAPAATKIASAPAAVPGAAGAALAASRDEVLAHTGDFRWLRSNSA